MTKKKTNSPQRQVERLVSLPSELKITVDYKDKIVLTEKYVDAKTKQLKEFGYDDLTRDELREQLLRVLNGDKLTVIGMFMQNEVARSN